MLQLLTIDSIGGVAVREKEEKEKEEVEQKWEIRAKNKIKENKTKTLIFIVSTLYERTRVKNWVIIIKKKKNNFNLQPVTKTIVVDSIWKGTHTRAAV